MSYLLYLPVEILQQIIKNADHTDVESITLSCKHLHNVGKSRLVAHRELKERYGRFTCGDPMKSWNDPGWGEHPARLLDMILGEPKIADYVTWLDLRDCYHLHNDPNIFLTPNGQIQAYPYASDTESSLDKRIEGVEEHLKDYLGQSLNIGMWDDFRKRVLALRKGSILALLLIVLPNLSTISFSTGFQRSIINPPWVDMLSDIAGMFAPGSNMQLPLGRLERLEVNDATYDPHLLALFMALPSLKFIRCQKAELRYPVEDLMLPPSSVVSLQMLQSWFPLEPVLSSISNLRVFECTHRPWRWQLREVPRTWTPRHLARTLLRHAGHSLTSLTLTGVSARCKTDEEHLAHDWIGSLRDFRVLKSIRLDLDVLIDISATVNLDSEIVQFSVVGDVDDNVVAMQIGDDFFALNHFDWNRRFAALYLDAAQYIPVVHRLINILPASAETIELEMQANGHIMQQLLDRLPERKAERLPNLKSISYECAERCTIGLEEACQAVGVQVTQVLKFGSSAFQRLDSLSNSDFSGFEDGDEPLCTWDDFEDDRLLHDEYLWAIGIVE